VRLRIRGGNPDLWRSTAPDLTNRGSDGISDLVLHRQQVVRLRFVGMRPEVIAVRGAIELRSDADMIAFAGEATFEHRIHVELLPDAAHVFAFALEGEC
jgi:hypothetical protein